MGNKGERLESEVEKDIMNNAIRILKDIADDDTRTIQFSDSYFLPIFNSKAVMTPIVAHKIDSLDADSFKFTTENNLFTKAKIK